MVEDVGERYGAKDLLNLPRNVAAAIVNRPGKFLEMVKSFFEPELDFNHA